MQQSVICFNLCMIFTLIFHFFCSTISPTFRLLTSNRLQSDLIPFGYAVYDIPLLGITNLSLDQAISARWSPVSSCKLLFFHGSSTLSIRTRIPFQIQQRVTRRLKEGALTLPLQAELQGNRWLLCVPRPSRSVFLHRIFFSPNSIELSLQMFGPRHSLLHSQHQVLSHCIQLSSMRGIPSSIDSLKFSPWLIRSKSWLAGWLDLPLGIHVLA